MTPLTLRLVLHGGLLAFLLTRRVADAVAARRFRRRLDPPLPKPRLPAARLLAR